MDTRTAFIAAAEAALAAPNIELLMVRGIIRFAMPTSRERVLSRQELPTLDTCPRDLVLNCLLTIVQEKNGFIARDVKLKSFHYDASSEF